MDIRFAWVDVFADTALEGNPVAVITDADGISDDVMKSIAREFNQSETTFVLAPTDPRADRRLRSFTPAGIEVGGAGHNVLGAWILLAASGALDPARRTFHQQIGDELLPVEVAVHPRIEIVLAQATPRFLRARGDSASLEEALWGGDGAARISGPAEVVSTGVPHLLVPLGSRHAVDAAVPRPGALLNVLESVAAEGCYVYSTEPAADGADAYARFFNPTVGIAEDPATGTAAGPLAALLLRDRAARSGEIRIVQGAVLGRPSSIIVRVDGSDVRLLGRGVIAATGTLHI